MWSEILAAAVASGGTYLVGRVRSRGEVRRHALLAVHNAIERKLDEHSTDEEPAYGLALSATAEAIIVAESRLTDAGVPRRLIRALSSGLATDMGRNFLDTQEDIEENLYSPWWRRLFMR